MRKLTHWIRSRVDTEKWYRERPLWLWVLTVAVMLAGSALIGWALAISGPGRGLLGVVLVTWGLRTFNWLVRSKLDRDWTVELHAVESTARAQGKSTIVDEVSVRAPDDKKPRQVALIGLGALVVGLTLVAIADSLRNWPLAFVGAAIVALSTGPFSLLLLYARESARVPGDPGNVQPPPPSVPRRWVFLGMVLVVVGWLCLSGGTGVWSAIGVLLILTGFTAYQLGLPGVCDANTSGHDVQSNDNDSRFDRLIARVTGYFPGNCIGRAGSGALVGAVLIRLGWWVGSTAITVLGGVLLVLSVVTLGVGLRRHADRRKAAAASADSWEVWWCVLGLAGAALVALVIFEVKSTDLLTGSVPAALAIAFVVALLGASLVWKGEGLFFGVLLATAVVFGMVDSTEPDTNFVSGVADAEVPRQHARVVAFGDSWISGEGVEEFFEGTDEPSNNCHRATTAYPVLIADAGFDGSLDFYACSGADIVDLIDVGRIDDNPCRDEEHNPKGQKPCSAPTEWGRDLQIEALPEDGGDATELVLVSVGGNDAGFGEIVAGCMLPGSCVERREVWLDNVATIGPDLERTYKEIREAFGNDTPVVVMPYPLVMLESSCDSSPLRSEEHAFIVEFTSVLDEQLQVSAKRAGVHFFEPGIFSFVGHRVCETGSDDRAINLIELQASDGNFGERINPKNWTNNSMHPNRLGHRLIAENLEAWLDAEGIIGSDNPPENENEKLEVRGVRPVRPFPIDTRSLLKDDDGEVVVPSECPVADIDGFATQVFVFDDPDKALGTGDDPSMESNDDDVANRWWPVPITGAATSGSVCYTDKQGVWRSVGVAEADQSALDTAPEAYSSVGELFLKGRIPDAEPPRDVQWVIFQGVPIGDQPGEWELRAVRFCSTGDLCEASFGDWRSERTTDAIRTVAPSLLLMITGGWLFAIGYVLGIRPRFNARKA